MAISSSLLLFFIFLFHLLLPLLAGSSSCPTSFHCQNFSSMQFPLSAQPGCGLFKVNCTPYHPLIEVKAGGTWYEILENISPNKLHVLDRVLQKHLLSRSCSFFSNLSSDSLPNNPSTLFTISPNLTMFRCSKGHHDEENKKHFSCQKHFPCHACPEFDIYYINPDNTSAVNQSAAALEECHKFQLPRNPDQHNSSDLFSLLTASFTLEWNISQDCMRCHERGGQCDTNYMGQCDCRSPAPMSNSQSPNPGPAQRNDHNTTVKVLLGICGGVLFIICLLLCVILWRCRKRTKDPYQISSEPFSPRPEITDIGGSFYYGIPLFSNDELEEATDNFNPRKILGDGGFGTVYHGILRDGREVAIKRLYEKNYKRVEQFMNEIKILTCLKHQNLVTLYGCTSRTSRELLLVYEYIPNGTVADHLHGERAKGAPLPWSVRMNIAIETASALAYLHKSDIVHRDVKTNNILLDNNFCVKVADFGLSRLFPFDVTHISTAPQGTPGYVDPEYHQCYQLTEKSDVYSFGVVLIELISSMPAVDITRHKYEINLANLALNKIQKSAFDELIDASLGYKTDAEIMRMTTSVAELAFQCLQLEKDMRPSMDEVLGFLREFKTYPRKIPPSPETDEVELLKNKNIQSSPIAITDAWHSGSTTTSSIG